MYISWRNFTSSGLAIIAAVALIAGTSIATAKNQSKIKGEFERSGSDDDASGKVSGSFSETKSKFSLTLKKLEPGEDYTLVIGGIPEGTFTSSSSGGGKLSFSQPASGSSLPLDFDPRGKSVEVDDSSSNVLNIVFSGSGEPAGISVAEGVVLQPTALAPVGSQAEAQFRVKKGQQNFEVEVEGLPAGSYDLYVDGVVQGAIVVGSTGRGQIEFESEPSAPNPLTFDPRGLPLDIASGTNIFFTGSMIAQIPSVNQCTPVLSEVTLTSTGADPDGSAKAQLTSSAECHRSFEVEVEDVPAGDYELSVGGVVQGTITVSTNNSSAYGQIEFESGDDNPHNPLLTFDPVNQPVIVRQGFTVFFTNTFTEGSSGTNATCSEIETKVSLLNTGVSGSAKGDMRFREHTNCQQDFRVEIEDLPAGSYDLVVAGVTQGTITVTNSGGELRGEIEFDTEPSANESLLDFDPRGQLIEVKQGATVFLNRAFPAP